VRARLLCISIYVDLFTYLSAKPSHYRSLVKLTLSSYSVTHTHTHTYTHTQVFLALVSFTRNRRRKQPSPDYVATQGHQRARYQPRWSHGFGGVYAGPPGIQLRGPERVRGNFGWNCHSQSCLSTGVCVCAWVWVFVFVSAYVCVYEYMCVSACVYMCVCVCIWLCVCVCVCERERERERERTSELRSARYCATKFCNVCMRIIAVTPHFCDVVITTYLVPFVSTSHRMLPRRSGRSSIILKTKRGLSTVTNFVCPCLDSIRSCSRADKCAIEYFECASVIDYH
jgi:hypothetical protein